MSAELVVRETGFILITGKCRPLTKASLPKPTDSRVC